MTRRALGIVLLAVIAAPARTETPSSVLQSLPIDVQKDIEETRAACQQNVDGLVALYRSPDWSGDISVTPVPPVDDALVTFTLGGKQGRPGRSHRPLRSVLSRDQLLQSTGLAT